MLDIVFHPPIETSSLFLGSGSGPSLDFLKRKRAHLAKIDISWSWPEPCERLIVVSGVVVIGTADHNSSCATPRIVFIGFDIVLRIPYIVGQNHACFTRRIAQIAKTAARVEFPDYFVGKTVGYDGVDIIFLSHATHD